MSVQKVEHSFIEFLSSTMRGPRFYADQKLAGENLIKVHTAQYLWLCNILDVRSSCGLSTTRRSFKRLVLVLNELEVTSWLRSLDAASAVLIRSVTVQEDRCIPWFKAEVIAEGGHEGFTNAICALITPILQRWLKSFDVSQFRLMRQLFEFAKRLSLKLDSLQEVAANAWLKVEMKDWPDQVAGPESKIISKWFPKRDAKRAYEHFSPTHGGGAVAEVGVHSLTEKYLTMTLSSLQREFLREVGFPYIDGNLMGTPWFSRDICAHPLANRVMFVPKSWKTYRTITMEPTSTMWLQQGVGACLDWYLKGFHTPFSRYYSVDSEEQNRTLAWLGSIDGSYSTIDLSSASDSVPWSLVQEWFADTWLMDALWSTRTPYGILEGREPILLKKFASMGSRLCFPVETIVFGAICESCLDNTDVSGNEPPFVVYGDDIVIRSEFAADVIRRLGELGFEVNTDKTFIATDGSHFFRESCGGEYLDGTDVTPLRLGRRFPGLLGAHALKQSPTAIAALIELANTFYFGGMRHTRLAIVRHLTQVCDLPIYFDKTGERGLATPNPTNMRYPTVWNEDYQRSEVLAWHLKSRKAPWDRTMSAYADSVPDRTRYDGLGLVEEMRLFEHLRQSEGRGFVTPNGRVSQLTPDEIISVRFDTKTTSSASLSQIDPWG